MRSMTSSPGRIAAEVAIPLPHPRNRLDAAFRAIVDGIYSTLTARLTEAIGAQRLVGGRMQALPKASINRMLGFLDRLASTAFGGEGELAAIARRLALSTGELLPLAVALHLLELEDHLTRREAEQTLAIVIAWGRYAEAFEYDDRKRLFALASAS